MTNLQVETADVNALEFTTGQFDRVISVEMFEHVRNYAELLQKISRWLTPQGRLFVHIFCHQRYLYPYETEGAFQLDGAAFFHRRAHARSGYAVTFPGPPSTG